MTSCIISTHTGVLVGNKNITRKWVSARILEEGEAVHSSEGEIVKSKMMENKTFRENKNKRKSREKTRKNQDTTPEPS